MFWLHKTILKLFIVVFFFLFLFPVAYSLDFNIYNLGNNLDLNYINIDTNQAVFRIDINSSFYPFDLNLISLDIDSSYLFEDFLLFKDINVNGLFDSNDLILDVNLNYSPLVNNNYDLNISCGLGIESNTSLFIVVNLNTGVGNAIDFSITNITSSIDGNINYLDSRDYLIVPRQVIDTGNIFYNSILLDYYSFSDINGEYVSDINSLNLVLDSNIFRLYIDGNDYKDYNFQVSVEDYNAEYNDYLHFNLGEGVINISNSYFDIDFNISNFNIIEDYYYLVDENILYIFDYNNEFSSYSLVSSIDTNDIIYAVDTYDYNLHTYLFLANNSNGIRIYDITDQNISDLNNNYIGNVVFTGYNTNYLESFKTPNNLDYLIASVHNTDSVHNTGFGGIVLYKIEDLIGLDGTILYDQKIISDQWLHIVDTFYNDVDSNKLFVSFKNKKSSYGILYDYNSEELFLKNAIPHNSNSYSSFFKLNNRMFEINFDRNQIDSYDYTDFSSGFKDSFDPLSSYSSSQSIFAMTPYYDINKIIVLFENKIEILDYNFDEDMFYLDHSYPNISVDTSNIYQKMKIVNDTLFVGQINKLSFFDFKYNDLNFTSYYYLPTIKTSDLILSKNNISYEVYNDINFTGDINLNFKLYDYNIEVGNNFFEPYSSSIYFKDSHNLYPIENNLNLDNLICNKENSRIYDCQYTFNIKNINNTQNIIYSDNYNLYLEIPKINYLINTSFKFNLAHSTPSNSSENGSKNNDGPSSNNTPLEKVDSDTKLKKISNLQLIEKEYNTLKQLFEKYFLIFPIINFDLNKDLPQDLFDIEYNLIISNYENLPKIEIKDRKEITTPLSLSLLDFDLLEYNYKIVSKKLLKFYTEIHYVDSNNAESKYSFIEIIIDDDYNTDENTQLIIDYVPNLNIIKSIPSVDLFSNSFIKFTTDINYLINFNNSAYLPIALLKITVNDPNLEIINSLNTDSKNTNSKNWGVLNFIYFLLFIFFIFYLYFLFKRIFFGRHIRLYFKKNKSVRYTFNQYINSGLKKLKLFSKRIKYKSKNKLNLKRRKILKKGN